MQEHDLVVIGAGPGGYVAAIRAAQLGLNVGCVEKENALGGTCLRIGCIPSKALLESSERFREARESLAAHGINVGKVELDLAKMLKRQQEIVGGLAKGVESLLKKNKIIRYLGHGRIVGTGRVNVEGPGELVELKAKHILIATGSKPGGLPDVAIDAQRIGTSTEALGYESVPEHLVVIGAGSIGLELGSVWRRLGARVTVLEFLDRILPSMDSELAFEAQKHLTKQGLEFTLQCKVTAAYATTEHAVVEYEGGGPIRCDRVLVAVGRVPNTDDLGLDSVNIRLDGKGRILVNGTFATSADGIHAIGDVIAGPMLAHKAEEEGVACAEFLATGHGHVNYEAIPSVVYTHPEFAGVGQTEDDLKQSGTEYHKGVFPFSANGRARALDQTEGRVKVLADARTDRLLGVHILGPRAGDLIAEAATAMAFGASSEDLARTCHAHPTLAEAFREAALAVDRRAIHG
jgi:dihydrolipoamide dehydrogenase